MHDQPPMPQTHTTRKPNRHERRAAGIKKNRPELRLVTVNGAGPLAGASVIAEEKAEDAVFSVDDDGTTPTPAPAEGQDETHDNPADTEDIPGAIAISLLGQFAQAGEAIEMHFRKNRVGALDLGPFLTRTHLLAIEQTHFAIQQNQQVIWLLQEIHRNIALLAQEAQPAAQDVQE